MTRRDPGKAVMFPVTWGPPGRALSFSRSNPAQIVKMKWTKDRFVITYSDGQTYTQLKDCDLDV